MPYEGAFVFNTRHDWRKPRLLAEAYDINGVLQDISDRVISATATLNSSYAADTYNLELSNKDGYLTDNFTYANEIKIYATFDQFDQEKLISGRIEVPGTSYSKGDGAKAKFTGKDWTVELQNVSALEVYKKGSFTAGVEPYVGEIIRDLIQKYVPEVSAGEVPDTTTQINYKVFARTSVYDCIKFLADLINYRFYVDADKMLQFEPIPSPILMQDSFEGSGDPAGWIEESGDWEQLGGHYKQSTDTGSFTTYVDGYDLEDQVVDCYINIDSGSRAGVALRIDGSGNHYFLAIDVVENCVRLFSVEAWTGTETEIAIGVPTDTLQAGVQYHLRVYVKTTDEGAHFTAFLDDMVHSVLNYMHADVFVTSGMVGLRTEDAIVFFDEFTAANAYLVIDEAFNAIEISMQRELPRQKNRIIVQGGYEKFPVEEVVTPSGSSNTITLSHLPSETKVTITGASGNPQKGGIYGIDDDDPTIYFLVDYYSKRLIRSGGLNWDAVVTTINYNKNLPLIGYTEDTSTFATNGRRDYVHTDKLLNTQSLVDAKAAALLEELKDVPRTGSARVPGAVWLVKPGDYMLVRSASNGIPDWTMMKADSITINFSKNEGLVYSFSLDNESPSLPLLLNSLEQRIRKLERRDIAEALVQFETPSDGSAVDDAIVGESNLINAALKLGHYAKLGYERQLGNTSGGWGAAF